MTDYLQVQNIHRTSLVSLKKSLVSISQQRHAVIGPNGAGKRRSSTSSAAGSRPPWCDPVQRTGYLRQLMSAIAKVLRAHFKSPMFSKTDRLGEHPLRRPVPGTACDIIFSANRTTIARSTSAPRPLPRRSASKASCICRSAPCSTVQRALEIAITLSTEPESRPPDEPTAGNLRAEETAQAISMIDRVTAGRTLVIRPPTTCLVFARRCHIGPSLRQNTGIRHPRQDPQRPAVKDAYSEKSSHDRGQGHP